MVRAFSEQGAKVGFVDMHATRGVVLAEETGTIFVSCDLRDIDALREAFAAMARPRSGAGVGQQRRARRSPRLGRGNA